MLLLLYGKPPYFGVLCVHPDERPALLWPGATLDRIRAGDRQIERRQALSHSFVGVAAHSIQII